MVSLGSQISGFGRVGSGWEGRADPDMRRAVSKN